MNLKITNQLALVTASTGGIGMEIAATLAEEGARGLVNGRIASGVESAMAKIRERNPGAHLLPLVAGLVAYVCGEQASAINGAALRVHGGIVRSVM